MRLIDADAYDKKLHDVILGSGVKSNAWCETPVTGKSEIVRHDHVEDVVFVALDTLFGDDAIIKRFALKDVEIIPTADVVEVVRYKDCHHWKDFGYCKHLEVNTEEDYFCVDGRRKDGDA